MISAALVRAGFEDAALIHEGPLAKVYRCTDRRAATGDVARVAVKLAASPTANSMIEGEARLTCLAAAASPMVPALVDAGELEGRAYLAVAWIDGLPLAKLNPDARAGLGPAALRLLIADMGQRVVELHEGSPPLLHCDLGPDNFLLDRRGELHLIDFGLAAELINDRAAPDTLPIHRPQLAPERLLDHPWDRAGDVYLVGAAAYELLTGRLAYPAFPMPGSAEARLDRRLRRQLRDPRVDRPELAGDLVEAVMAAVRPRHPDLREHAGVGAVRVGDARGLARLGEGVEDRIAARAELAGLVRASRGAPVGR